MLPAQFGDEVFRRRLQHPLVQQGHAFLRPTELDQDAALGHDPGGDEVAVRMPAAEALHLARLGHRLLAAVEGGLHGEVEEVSLLGAIRLVVHETLGTVHPAAADGFVPPQEVGVGDVEGPHGGAPVVRRLEVPLVGLLPRRQ